MFTIRLLFTFALLAPLTAAQEHVFIPVDDDPDGDGPVTVEYAPDGSAILILHHHSDNVAFLDPVSQTATDLVPVGERPLDMAISSSLSYAVTADHGSSTASVVWIPLRTKVGTVPLSGSRPYQVEVSADGLTAVVGLAGDGPGASSVSVVDLQTLTEVRSFAVVDQQLLPPLVSYTGENFVGQVFPRYPRFALAPDDRTLVLPDHAGERVRLYDYTTGKKAGRVSVGLAPTAVGVSPDGSFAVAVENLDHGISGYELARVDLTTLASNGPFVVPFVAHGDGLVVTNSRAVMGTPWFLQFVDPLTGSCELTMTGGEVLAISEDASFIVTASEYDVGVVDVANRTLVERIHEVAGRHVAVSPTANEAAILVRGGAEEIHLLEASVASIDLLATVPTGIPEEGDGPVRVAVAEDAGLVLTANGLSRNIAVIDAVGGKPVRWIALDNRSFNVAVDRVGTVAVALTLEGLAPGDLHVIDLQAGTVEATFPISTRALAIAPDGSHAYAIRDYYPLPQIAVTQLAVFELAGPASKILATFTLPDEGYYYSNRLLALSSMGVLALRLTGAHELRLYDTSALKKLDIVALDQSPYAVEFAPDGRHVYAIGWDELYKVKVDGASSHVVGRVKLAKYLKRVAVGPQDRIAYVLASDSAQGTLHVVDTQEMKVVSAIPIAQDTLDMALSGPFLVLSTFGGQLIRFRAAGEATTRVDVVELGDYPRDLILSEGLSAAVTAQPGERDGVDIVRYGGSEASYCGPANLNSTGRSATITASGWKVAGFEFGLQASALPPHEIGYFLVSDAVGFVPFVGGSQGNLCLGGSIARFADQASSSGPAGRLKIVVDTSALPFSPPLGVQPGETWYFQAWFRDHNPGPTSNMTDGVAVTFD